MILIKARYKVLDIRHKIKDKRLVHENLNFINIIINMKKILSILSLLFCANAFAQKDNLQTKAIAAAATIEQKEVRIYKY